MSRVSRRERGSFMVVFLGRGPGMLASTRRRAARPRPLHSIAPPWPGPSKTVRPGGTYRDPGVLPGLSWPAAWAGSEWLGGAKTTSGHRHWPVDGDALGAARNGQIGGTK